MKWCRCLAQWIIIIIITSVEQSEPSCEMLKKSVTFYRVERILYRYVTCTKMTPNDEINGQILSALNSSSQYLEITNSNLPEINKEMFISLNFTQVTIEAGVQIVQEKSFERSNISTIILDNNSIRRIKDGAFKSYAINMITLQNNFLTEIGTQMFLGAANLRNLNLRNNSISSIKTDAFKNLDSLEDLNLSLNRLNTLAYNLFLSVSKLQTINLNNNYLKEVEPNLFINNKMLQYVYINNNHLTTLDATYFPNSLLELNAENNDLTFVNISNLLNLNTVVLNFNKISKLNNCLNNLPALNFLHLNNNLLFKTALSDASTFSGLNNLSVLEIDNNLLKSFSFKSVQSVKTLQGVSLVGNNITQLDFYNLPEDIKVLNLSQNFITELKNFSKLSTLLKLEISYNKLYRIDFDTFNGLGQLHSLWLNHNLITSLALGCFRNLKILIHLDLSYNKITNVSAGALNGLDSMSELDLSHNQISYLNEDIFHNLKNLKFLSIAHNNLTHINIRTVLSHVIWLREIDMDGNNWTCKLLISISRDNKLLQIKGGNIYNVSNIYGIPCRENVENEEGKHYMHSEDNLSDILVSLNSTVAYAHDVSFKLSFIIVLLSLFLILICGKIIISKYSTQVTAAKQFIYQKSESEPEIHLLN